MPEDLSYLFGEENKEKKKGGKLKTVAMYGGAGLLAFLGGAALALMAMSPEQRNEAIEKLKGLLGSIGGGIAGAGRWAGGKIKGLWDALFGTGKKHEPTPTIPPPEEDMQKRWKQFLERFPYLQGVVQSYKDLEKSVGEHRDYSRLLEDLLIEARRMAREGPDITVKEKGKK